jgi:hypothetical protein
VFSKVSKYHAIIIVLGFTWQWREPAIFRTLGDHAFMLTFTLPSQSANLGWIRIIVSETIGKPRVNPHYTAEPIGKPRVNPHYTAEPIGKARVNTHYTVEPIFKPRVNPLHSFYMQEQTPIDRVVMSAHWARTWVVQGVRAMVFNVTFNNISAISWQSLLLLEETGSGSPGVRRENHRSVASHWVVHTKTNV